MNSTLEGVIVPTITPLSHTHEFDELSMRALLQHLIRDAKVHGTFILGYTGETAHFPNRTRQKIMKVASDEVRMLRDQGLATQLLTGINGDSESETLANIAYANSLETQGLVLRPGTLDSDPSRLLDSVLDATEKPVYLYVNQSAGDRLSVDQIQRYSSRVTGIKVTAKPDFMTEVLSRNYESPIYLGDANQLVDVFQTNHTTMPTGVVTGPGNFLPLSWKLAWEACCNHDMDEMRRAQKFIGQFKEIYKNLPSGSNTIATLKWFMKNDADRAYEHDGKITKRALLETYRCHDATGNLSRDDCKYLRKKSIPSLVDR